MFPIVPWELYYDYLGSTDFFCNQYIVHKGHGHNTHTVQTKAMVSMGSIHAVSMLSMAGMRQCTCEHINLQQ